MSTLYGSATQGGDPLTATTLQLYFLQGGGTVYMDAAQYMANYGRHNLATLTMVPRFEREFVAAVVTGQTGEYEATDVKQSNYYVDVASTDYVDRALAYGQVAFGARGEFVNVNGEMRFQGYLRPNNDNYDFAFSNKGSEFDVINAALKLLTDPYFQGDTVDIQYVGPGQYVDINYGDFLRLKQQSVTDRSVAPFGSFEQLYERFTTNVNDFFSTVPGSPFSNANIVQTVRMIITLFRDGVLSNGRDGITSVTYPISGVAVYNGQSSAGSPFSIRQTFDPVDNSASIFERYNGSGSGTLVSRTTASDTGSATVFFEQSHLAEAAAADFSFAGAVSGINLLNTTGLTLNRHADGSISYVSAQVQGADYGVPDTVTVARIPVNDGPDHADEGNTGTPAITIYHQTVTNQQNQQIQQSDIAIIPNEMDGYDAITVTPVTALPGDGTTDPDSLDRSNVSITRAPTAAARVRPTAPAPVDPPIITGAQIGSIFGSSIGQALAGDNVFARVAAGSALAATLQTIGGGGLLHASFEGPFGGRSRAGARQQRRRSAVHVAETSGRHGAHMGAGK